MFRKATENIGVPKYYQAVPLTEGSSRDSSPFPHRTKDHRPASDIFSYLSYYEMSSGRTVQD